MNALSLIQLALNLLGVVLSGLKGSDLPAEITADVSAAVQKLEGVLGTPVTYGQLEGLRVNVTFTPVTQQKS